MLVLNKLDVQFGILYVLAGLLLWILFFLAGIHPTISGVLTAFIIPANTKVDFSEFKNCISNLIKRIDSEFKNRDKHFERANDESKQSIGEMSKLLKRIEPPLQRYEKTLKSYVNFFIVPLFAFANAGIRFADISLSDFVSPLSLGIIFGLMIGKSTGIFVFSVVASKSKLAHLPAKALLEKIYGVSWLCGIGFTMSIFIAELSFSNAHYLNVSKASIFIGSILSALIGVIIILASENIPTKGRKTSV
jgi:NhaA family Na+:H+ antiporter